jgi:phosphatidylserine/phosphatidylglycerophosphate/cardiolipin synthase-like enzyme
MIDDLLTLPSHLRERLAGALESGMLPIAPSAQALRSVLGNFDGSAAVGDALSEMKTLGASPQALAAWMRASVRAESRRPQADLVWSGPEVRGLHARDTARVYEEVIEWAQRSLYLSTYAFFDAPKAFQKLATRMEVAPELRVVLLLNIQRKRGDTTKTESVVRQFADRFWNEWPGTLHPNVFYDPRALDLGAPGGVLHAKAVLADEEIVFITSANLTEAAFDRNIELGLLARDRTIAANVAAHFRALIDFGLLVSLPSH